MGFPAKFLEAGAALDQRNLEPAQQPLLRPPFQAAPSYHPGAEEVVYFFLGGFAWLGGSWPSPHPEIFAMF